MKVTCNDGCQEEFTILAVKTEGIEKLSNNVERYYIECPNCGQQYTSYYLNDELKQMQAEIQELQKKHPLKIKQKNKLTKLKRKIQFAHHQLKMKVEHSLDNSQEKGVVKSGQ